MSYEAWRISYQSSEQAAQAAYAQLQAVCAAAKALSEATCEREADDAQEALEAAAGGDLNGITENIIQSFLISYNTLPHATHNEFANINAYFDWWKAKRREEKKQQEATPCPPR
tara:strand:- start:985 stop:1326 length:342 start_codon:yes stop_codon:yes gene_type:complete